MDMTLSPEDEAFRAEVRAFLDEKLTQDMRDESATVTGITAERPLAQRWLEILNERGWAVPAWPVELGGTGWNVTQHYIFTGEQALASAPFISPGSTGLAAPTIIAFGTQEQKDKYLERTKSGEYWWCQGYSEPGAGSDLAALKCKAERDGDHYVINGSKIWTTHAHMADLIFCLVRIDFDVKPQKGISFLVFDVKLPGITIRPIISLAGEHELNEVFFDNVRVPVSALVGEENDGWSVAKHLLVNERLMSYAPFLRWRYKYLKNLVSEEPGDDARPLIEDAVFSQKLAEAGVLLDALEIIELRMLARIKAGEMIGAESSQIKIKGTELRQLMTEIAMEAVAYYAMPMQPTATHVPHADTCIGAPHTLAVMGQYLNDRAATIYAGTNEVLRSQMAKQVLGL